MVVSCELWLTLKHLCLTIIHIILKFPLKPLKGVTDTKIHQFYCTRLKTKLKLKSHVMKCQYKSCMRSWILLHVSEGRKCSRTALCWDESDEMDVCGVKVKNTYVELRQSTSSLCYNNTSWGCHVLRKDEQ